MYQSKIDGGTCCWLSWSLSPSYVILPPTMLRNRKHGHEYNAHASNTRSHSSRPFWLYAIRHMPLVYIEYELPVTLLSPPHTEHKVKKGSLMVNWNRVYDLLKGTACIIQCLPSGRSTAAATASAALACFLQIAIIMAWRVSENVYEQMVDVCKCVSWV